MESFSVLTSLFENEDDDTDDDEDKDDDDDIELLLKRMENQLRMKMNKMMNLASCQPMWKMLLLSIVLFDYMNTIEFFHQKNSIFLRKLYMQDKFS